MVNDMNILPATTYRIFRLPKRGHTDDEYEDSAAIGSGHNRFAIGDGASESAFSKEWSQLLVEGYVQSNSDNRDVLQADFSALQEAWYTLVTARSLPWYAEAKVAQGAFSTLLGLTCDDPPKNGINRWHAIAIGDSCLCHVREGKLLDSFPYQSPGEFSNDPVLLGSRMPASQAVERSRWKFRGGTWLPGDHFWLMTDALAQWFLGSCLQGEFPWDRLPPRKLYQDSRMFPDLIEELRKQKAIRNDDVTLVLIQM